MPGIEEHAKQTEMLDALLDYSHAGYVFGPEVAFGELTPIRKQMVTWEAHDLYDDGKSRFQDYVDRAAPEKPEELRRKEVAEVLTKTTVYVPSLTAAELDTSSGHKNLVSAALATGGMYYFDQDIDRGNPYARRAVKEECQNARWDKLDRLHPLVGARRTMFDAINASIRSISAEDAPEVSHCFTDLVLCNEVKVYDHSKHYENLRSDARERYLDVHGAAIAALMVRDAGFQSVTSILHAAYRAEPKWRHLPPVGLIHADPQMQQKIQIWNAVARVADERGDWLMDSGQVPEKGVFSINPFNNYHPSMVSTLCRLAGIEDPAKVDRLHDWFKHFHTSNDGRKAVGSYITEMFFDQMRASIPDSQDPYREQYERYFTLAMRVGEISFVNMVGDIAMSGEDELSL